MIYQGAGNFGVPNYKILQKFKPVERNSRTFPKLEYGSWCIIEGEKYEGPEGYEGQLFKTADGKVSGSKKAQNKRSEGLET